VKPTALLKGVEIYKGFLNAADQRLLLSAVGNVVRLAPLFSPVTRFGKAMSVRMTSAGKYGWFSDRGGYRYVTSHPDGGPWPEIPGLVGNIWNQVTGLVRQPDCCLINFYGEGARMGLHQDRDEADFNWPVVSVSLGDQGLFRVGGQDRKAATQSLWLNSGDVLVLTGPSRLAFHGVDRIRYRSCSLLPEGGRINLTMRVVD